VLKILCSGFAVLGMAAVFSFGASAQVSGHNHIAGTAVGALPFNGPRVESVRLRARYYGGIYRGAAWPKRYYGNWRDSYSPYWAWDVAAGLLMTAPTYYDHGYYYYGVGFGDESGYEVSLDERAIACCMQRLKRFKSYDPISGTYFQQGGYR